MFRFACNPGPWGISHWKNSKSINGGLDYINYYVMIIKPFTLFVVTVVILDIIVVFVLLAEMGFVGFAV